MLTITLHFEQSTLFNLNETAVNIGSAFTASLLLRVHSADFEKNDEFYEENINVNSLGLCRFERALAVAAIERSVWPAVLVTVAS